MNAPRTLRPITDILDEIASRVAATNARTLSALLHAILVALFLIVILTERKEVETVDIQVIEAPSETTRLAPMPLRTLPKAQPKPKAPKAPPRAVFGASRKSLTQTDGEAVKAGNTVAKDPDTKTLRPEDAETLPIPVDDFLVSAMPQLVGDFRIPYPPEAKKKGIQGAVVFELLIDDQGKVRQANLIEGPGYGLNEAASIAIKNLVFKPAQIDGKSVAVKIKYAYRFILEK